MPTPVRVHRPRRPCGPRTMVATGLLLALHALPVWAQDGLKPPEGSWPRWQTRLTVMQAQRPDGAAAAAPSTLVVGDRYLADTAPLADGGGLRATGGLRWGGALQGTAGLGLPTAEGPGAVHARLATAPAGAPTLGEGRDTLAAYLGVGYTGWWVRSGLSLSADLGLLSPAWLPTGARLGRVPAAADAADAASRWSGWTPVVQVSLSYRF